MQLAATAPNETLDVLAARVYDLGASPIPAAARAAAEALVDANPFLQRIADVPAGTVIDVPPLTETQPAVAATRDEQTIGAALVVDRVRPAAALAQRQLLADIDAEAQDAHGALAVSRSAEVSQLAGSTPALADALPRMMAAAEARAAAAEELRGHQSAVFAQIAHDLDEITSAFGAAP